MGVIDAHTFIATIKPSMAIWLKEKEPESLEEFKVSFPHLYEAIQDMDEESNPLLVLYQFINGNE